MNILSLSLHIFTIYSYFLGILLHFTIFVLILLIFDLIMTLSERRNVVSFLNF